MRSLKLILIILFSIALSANETFAQESVEVSSDQFKEYQKEIDYSKTKRALVLKESNKPKKKKKEKKSNFGGLGALGGIFSLLAYVVIGGLIIAILYLIFANVKLDKKLTHQEIDEDEDREEHIEDIDVRTEYEKALASGNYRMALRMRFIEILQELSLSKKIHWRYEKTNRDYAQELKGSDIYLSFRKISNIFEWVWYGNQVIDKEEFDLYNASFDQFNEKDK